MNSHCNFTVFTPTFNRKDLLPRVYESLCRQTHREFEWVVVDDGSCDGTGELVKSWVAKADFPIRYYWQANSGKHVAINRGVEKAEGTFFLVLDSDDWLAPECLERLLHHWNSIPEDLQSSFAGVVALWANPGGEVVGSPFPHPPLDSDSVEIRTRYRVKGDNFGMTRTDILREFPFPEHLGDFVTESTIWNRIALRYKKRYVNEILAFKDYQKGGLSDRIAAVQASSPQAARHYHLEFISMPRRLPLDIRLRHYANYVRFSLHARIKWQAQATEVPSRVFWIMAYPVGGIVYLRDLRIIRHADERLRKRDQDVK